ncbi:MAG: beta-glycosidase [Dysgonamonadaceae bacterium]|jgi:glucosylceramidase|nr:beta-glycosidase [Dysgonamonadaceae bacterium]
MAKVIFILCACGIFVSCNKKIEWVTTTPDILWEQQDPVNIRFIKTDSVDAEIDISNPQQTIDGFGSCFNELGWTSLGALDEADREAIMHELFTPGFGANFTICRMPVGANDFSRDWYSYNETDGDFEMRNFSIDNDKETLIPFIRSALKYNPGIKLWASPWSPPTWMKTNNYYACKPSDDFFDARYHNDIKPEQIAGGEGTDQFIQDDAYLEAYALYFAKFIEAYRKENIPIFMVMPQNEFNSCQSFPSCTWLSSSLNRFVGRYLGHRMKEMGVEVMFGTMERPDPILVDTLLQDSESSRYITGVGFQWAGKKAIGTIHENYPDLKIYQTEQECGNGRNDWPGCCYSWTLLKHYLNNGANAYEYWNTSLEEGGMSRWGWRQNSLVTVNREDKTYKFTYEYYLLKHVSHYVLPGARFFPVRGTFDNLLAFQNTNGSYVLVIQNDKETETDRVIKIGEQIISISLKPHSFNTLIIDNR